MIKGDKASARTELQIFLNLTWDRAYVRDLVDLAKKYLADLGAP